MLNVKIKLCKKYDVILSEKAVVGSLATSAKTRLKRVI
jgi:hypothetical protein